MTGRRVAPALLVAAVALAGCASPAPGPAPQGTPASVSTSASASTTRPGSAAATGGKATAGPADPNGSEVAAALAAANFGKSAGSCAVTPTKNSLGGDAFESSCKGWNGKPEHWCADFAIWVWRNAGFDVKGLDAASSSFVRYGQSRSTARETPKLGDVLVFGRVTVQPEAPAHVGVVTAVRPDGSIDLANGNWGGQSGSDVKFATTSSVGRTTLTADQARAGGPPVASMNGMVVVAVVAPARKG